MPFQPTSPAPRIAAIESSLQPFIDQHEIAGAVTLVADENRILHFSATGLADIEHGRSMQRDTIFWVASMTKLITATAAMMLVEEGKIAVDDPVAKYIPEFANLKTPSGLQANLTLRQCLTHTSGLQEAPPEKERVARTLAELIPASLDRPTLFEPGTKWTYSQSGINTIGRVIEVVSRQSFPNFLQQRLLSPLGMKDATFYVTPNQASRLATSYKLTEGKLAPTDIHLLLGHKPTDRDRFAAPNMGLFCTAEDYVRFCQMLLNGGTYGGIRYLKPESVHLMTNIQTGSLTTGFTPGNGWGLGFCVVDDPQDVTGMLSPGTFGHGGAYGTQAWIDPVKGRIYILMVQRANFLNSDGSEVRKAFQQAAVDALQS